MTRATDDMMLDHAARRAQAHPQFLGWVLARYRQLQNLSEENLADTLGVAPHDWRRLGLCLRPRDTHFADDIRQISIRFQADPSILAQVVRMVESVEAMAAEGTQSAITEGGLLMAARARKKPSLQSSRKKQNHEPSAS